jgi:hypothetical protein
MTMHLADIFTCAGSWRLHKQDSCLVNDLTGRQ